MSLDYAKPPHQVMCLHTGREVERLKAHIGFNQAPLDRRPNIYAVEHGILTMVDAYGGSRKDASMMGVLRILDAIPKHAGPDVARKAISDAESTGELRPYPRNSLTHIQVGDTIGEGTVHSIIDGTRVLKNGDPVNSVSRRALGNGAKCIVTFDSPKGGFWRREYQLPEFQSKVALARRDLPRLRGIDRDLKAEIRDEIRSVRKGEGSAERLLNLSGIATALHRILDTEGKGNTSERKAEAAFMRLRQRDLVALDAALKRPEHDGSYPMGRPVDLALAMVATERREIAVAIKAVNKVIRAERPEPEAAPAP